MAGYVPGGRGVAAARGWDWIVAGWGLFRKQPVIWIALFLAVAILVAVLHLAGLFGLLVLVVLTPAIEAGIGVATRELEAGHGLRLDTLLVALRERFGALAAIGGLMLAAVVLISLVVGIGLGLTTGASLLAVAQGTSPDLSVPEVFISILLALLAVLALLLPVLMAAWFAPFLVVFHGTATTQALRESFVACLRNLAPFLLYGVALLVLGVLASIPAFLGWLALGPVLFASLYVSYKDIFTAA